MSFWGQDTSTPQPCQGLVPRPPGGALLLRPESYPTLFFRSLAPGRKRTRKKVPANPISPPPPWDYLCLGQLFLVGLHSICIFLSVFYSHQLV